MIPASRSIYRTILIVVILSSCRAGYRSALYTFITGVRDRDTEIVSGVSCSLFVERIEADRHYLDRMIDRFEMKFGTITSTDARRGDSDKAVLEVHLHTTTRQYSALFSVPVVEEDGVSKFCPQSEILDFVRLLD